MQANLAVRKNGELPANIDELFELDKPLYGTFAFHLRNEV